MNSERLRMLEQFMKEEPRDPFIVYALALEYIPVQPEKARQLFDLLLEHYPEYIPTYYQAGNLFLQNGEPEKGVHILKLGIEKSRIAGDVKAMQEIQGILDTLEID